MITSSLSTGGAPVDQLPPLHQEPLTLPVQTSTPKVRIFPVIPQKNTSISATQLPGSLVTTGALASSRHPLDVIDVFDFDSARAPFVAEAPGNGPCRSVLFIEHPL